MFAHFTHASSEAFLHTLKDDARHQSRSLAECCSIWPFVHKPHRKDGRKDGNGNAHNGGISYQPPRHAMSAK